MIWIFERGRDETLSLETRFDNDTGEFVLMTHLPGGGLRVERFNNRVAFRERLEVLETQLSADQWKPKGTVFLHDGWKIT